jgi:hypothetical protein
MLLDTAAKTRYAMTIFDRDQKFSVQMIESNKTKRIGMNIFYVCIQEELPNTFYNINQEDNETLEDLNGAGKMTLKWNRP